jgi:hypothetical protein
VGAPEAAAGLPCGLIGRPQRNSDDVKCPLAKIVSEGDADPDCLDVGRTGLEPATDGL